MTPLTRSRFGDDDTPLEPFTHRHVTVTCPDSAADASYFAAALARQFARVGESSGLIVLADGQPGAGGLDVVLDLDAAPGARWAALRGAEGAIDGEKLLGALPSRDGVAVLSHGRRLVEVAAAVRRAAFDALAVHAPWIVETAPPSQMPADADVSILLVRGSVCAMAGAHQLVEAMPEEANVIAVVMEANQDTRLIIGDELGVPVVGHASPRWRMAHGAAVDVMQGRWPGEGDATMTRLVQEVAGSARASRRALSWA